MTGIRSSVPVTKLTLRVEQLETSDGALTPPEPSSNVAYRMVDAPTPLCARHAFELRPYLPEMELRALLDDEQIAALVIEFGLRKEDLFMLHGHYMDEECVMCGVRPNDELVCWSCNRRLHPEWPAVYCSTRCALADAR